ncbi:MAG: 4Fe-4S dicluster domain-containing protein [Desulfobacteraceae bacterium]|nr:MAG: 4Fe-4S dicluster domain-containing protein [Desulfobacteraceae bacterium]
MLKLKNVQKVAAFRLCLGCGVCYSVCPARKVQLIDVAEEGIRPFVEQDGCKACSMCLKACPGVHSTIACRNSAHFLADSRLVKRWGPFIELWEGYSSDPEIRFKGSSGGLCTALSLFCLEQGTAGGVLHIGSDHEKPLKNKTFRSTTRDELIARTGSRYAPAAPGNGLRMIENAPDQSVFIGKPCDVAGLRLAQQIRPELNRKTALAVGFFCAGTPSTIGTMEFLRKNGADPSQIAELRYRGMGWPGMATAHFKDNKKPPLKTTYNDSWGFIQKYRPFRCYLCPDLTAEHADIAVGDPWYRELGKNDPGRSLILIRTEKGREIFHRAMKQGYVTAEPADPEIIYRSQKNLLSKRQAIWGRLAAMKLLGIPSPELVGYHLFENWMGLPLKEKIRSIVGTARRIIQRNYFKPAKYEFNGCRGRNPNGMPPEGEEYR